MTEPASAAPGDTVPADLAGAVDIDFDLDLAAAPAPAAAAAAAVDIDFDFDMAPDLGFDDTRPPEPAVPVKRVLVINPDLNERLYLRARLSLQNLTQVDDAATLAEGLTQAAAQPYALAIVNIPVDAEPGWKLVADLMALPVPVGQVVVTASQAWWWTRRRARKAGVKALLAKPYDPMAVVASLQDV